MADAHSDWHLDDHVHQATGMIAEQLNCDVSEALARLKIRAASTGLTLDVMALDVLDHVVRFDGRPINCRSASHDSRADKPANQAKSLLAVFVLAARSAAMVRS
jgi:hypothetical protein